jgi:hypothetical protein
VSSAGQWTWRAAVAFVLVEAALVAVYVVLLAVAREWRIFGYFLMWAVAFAGLGWALVRRRRWVRAPLIVLQFLLAASGVVVQKGGAVVLGVVLVVLAVACTGFLMAPATRDTLGAR